MDEPQWYYLRNGGSQGPETSSHLLELLDSGVIDRQTPIWREGVADWQPLELALELSEHLPPAIPGAATISSIAPTLPVVNAVSSALASDGGYSDLAPHPWRRYFARFLDITLGGALMSFVLGILLFVLDQNTYNSFVAYIGKADNQFVGVVLNVALAMVPNAVLIGLTRSSIGKLIFGVRVSRLDGSPMGLRTAFWREVLVWARGLAFGIPIISLFTLVNAFNHLKKTQSTSWDKELGLRVDYRPSTHRQMLLNLLGVAAWIGSFIFLTYLSYV